VHLPNLGASAGHVQVTAYGKDTNRCKVAGWGPSESTQHVAVRCFAVDGSPADARFTLTYVQDGNILGEEICCYPNGNPSAYAWANEPASASYTPNANYQFSRIRDDYATASRSGPGSYSIKFQHTGLGDGNVAVTAWGNGPEFCKVAYWDDAAGILTRCFTAGGLPSDSEYDVAFTGRWVLG
jgi:hypothetical protein